jgi:DNA-directed RNA polymerase subunit RPC12/RpoP
MVDVQSIKCPNCGAAVHGTGAVTCPYCGSALEVAGKTVKEQIRAVRRAFGTAGVDVGVEPPFIFQHLPGVEITRETKDIPFQPKVIFSRLPGGEPKGALREEADAIVNIVRGTQDAINREDMAAYMESISTVHAKFRRKAQEGAHTQFVTTDMKRFTPAIEFQKLSPAEADIIVTVEVFIFLNSGGVNHIQVPFRWKLHKERGRWVVYDSSIPGSGGVSKLWILIISIILPVVIGILVAIISAVSQCGSEETVVTSSGDEVTVWKAESRKAPMPDTWFKARTNLRLYESPRDDAETEAILKAGAEFQVMGKWEDWYHVSTRDHTWGWVPADVMKVNLGKDYKLVNRR